MAGGGLVCTVLVWWSVFGIRALMTISMGIALAVQNQMSMALILENSLGKPAAEIMRAMSDAGLKLMADDTDIMKDAAVLFPKMYLNKEGKTDLKVVKE